MGVPHFMHWLTSRYPLIARRMDGASRPRFDCFFVDFNCIIHTAMRSNKTIEENNEDEIITEVLRFLDTLIQIIQPTSLIFISVDGPAPFAKCIQQRSRRFIRERKTDASGKTNIFDDDGASPQNSSSSEFSSNAISVGTEFMEMLHKKLSEFLKERVTNDICWQSPKVMYSSYLTPGEGEHKFFDFIRSQRKFHLWNEDASCCVYSPDADLVFVCLQSQIKNFSILRESEQIFPEIVMKASINDSGVRFCANDFVLVSINLLREYMMLDFDTTDQRIFDDFSALSYLIGNDFIPSFPDVKIDKGEFSILVDLYKSNFLSKRKFLVDGLSFNILNLSEFIKESAIKIALLKGKAANYRELYECAEERLRNKLPDEYAKDPEYLKMKMSHAVLDSFYWVLHYYKEGVLSWSWYYPFHYAPSIVIVADFISNYHPDFDISSPPMPFVQLLSILPPQSKSLLPSALQPLMDANTSPIARFYPTEFKIDRGGNKSEGTAIVPFVVISEVKEALNSVYNNLSASEKERNKIVPPYLVSNEGLSYVDETKKIVNFRLFSNDALPPCIPTLFFYDIKPKVVTFPHFNESNALVLSFSLPLSPKNANNAIGKTVLVGWPYFVPAVVKRSIMNNTNNNDNNNNNSNHNYSKNNGYNNNSLNKNVINNYYHVYGLDISDTKCFLCVNVLQFADNHETILRWSQEEVLYPFQQTAPICATNTIRRFETAPLSRPNVNDIALIVRGNNFGLLCRLNSFEKGGNVNVTIINHHNCEESVRNIFSSDKRFWIPFQKVSERYGITTEIVEAVLTDLHTETYKTNIAFIIIKSKKGVEGFCKGIKTTKFVTSSVLEMLDNYFKFTNPLLSKLQSVSSSNNRTIEVVLDEFFNEKGESFGNDIKNWVKSNSPSHNFPFRKLYQHSYAHDTITAVEKALIESQSNRKIDESTDGGFKNENIRNLIWKGSGQYSSMKIGPRSRVVSIAPSGVVPFGTFGFVIGTSFNQQIVHVIADDEFPYGNRMKGCLQTNRGFIISVFDLFKL